MGLRRFKKSKLHVEVLGSEIVVKMPGTNFNIVYEKTDDNQLIANSFSGKVQDEKGQVSFPRFLALAWTAANAKAREIGWIA